MSLIKCPECGKEVSNKASSCPVCGHPLGNVPPTQSVTPPKQKQKKKGSCLKTILIVLGVLIAIIVIANLSDNGKDSSEKKSTESLTENSANAKTTSEQATETTTAKETTQETESQTTKPLAESFETDLSAGHYTAGKDFPIGNYNLSAVSGNGNVNSSNMYSGGLNEIMSNPKDEYSIDNFSNAKLTDGVVLSISGNLVLHIQSDSADVASLTPRSDPSAAPVDLASGNYTAGQDFPAGTYNVIATGGSGNVSSSNIYDGGINEILGTDNDGFSIKEFKNLELLEGTTLSISGTSIQLIQVSE